MESNNNKKIYVMGHKNPDTDSICSAIAYANLKQKLSNGKQYVAKRLGLLNAETEYVLERFHVQEPSLLSNVNLKLKDVDISQIAGIKANTSIRDAWEIMSRENVFSLAVTEDDALEGVISIRDIAMSYMDVYDNRILATAKTQYKNIVKTLDGEIVIGDENRFLENGKVVVAASSPEKMEAIIESGDVVILGNRYEVQLCAIELEVSCIIVCKEEQVTRTIKKLAEERGIIIITTPHDTYTAARLINQSIPVEYFMKKDGIKVFKTTDFVEDIKKDVVKDRTRDFPVVDKNNNFYGFVSSRRLMDVSKRQVILVDHNEESQTVDGIGDAEILEIIDHHRLGGLETVGPVYLEISR